MASSSVSVPVAAQVAQVLGPESYWVCNKQKTVYGLFLYSPYAFPNRSHPYQLRIRAFQPSSELFYAYSTDYLGGISNAGTIDATDYGWQGQLMSPTQIVWQDGSVWTRKEMPADHRINQYSALGNFQQAERNSQAYSQMMDRAYPNIYRSVPF